MEQAISQLVQAYETGKVTRRQLVSRLGALAAFLGGAGRLFETQAAQAEEGAAESTFEATELNHIALRTTDVARSRDWYVKHLGLKVSREGDSNCFLTCGNNFVALFKGEEAKMDHYCYSVKGYNVRDAERKLKAEGIKPTVRGGNRIYFPDPDGLTVQLAAESHQP
jgi:catechol 2,3-dioxygenase-like lactoylglutathione lyase family enzyme